MREILTSGSERGELGTLHDMRIVRHVRGNPDIGLRRSLNEVSNSSTRRLAVPASENFSSSGPLLLCPFQSMEN